MEKRSTFRDWLRQIKELRGYTSKELAIRLGIGSSLVSYYLSGARTPHPRRLPEIAQALHLTDVEYGGLLASFAATSKPTSGAPDSMLTLGQITQVFVDVAVSPVFKQQLFSQIDGVFKQWKIASQRSVRCAVIPLAGWQHRLLPAPYTSRLLAPLINEVTRAGLTRILLVTAPYMRPLLSSTPEWQTACRSEKLDLGFVEQDEPLGLGHAVKLAAQKLNADEPFAVLLPDDLLNVSCLSSMVTAYGNHRCSLVALRDFKSGDQRSHGLAYLDKPLSSPFWTIKLAAEKPGHVDLSPRPVKTIVGRFIFTSEILELLPRLELTDALGELARRGRAAALLYRGAVLTLPRHLLERQIEQALKPWMKQTRVLSMRRAEP